MLYCGKVYVGGRDYPVEGVDCYVGRKYHVDMARSYQANQTQNESGIVLDSIIVPRAHTCNEIKGGTLILRLAVIHV